MAIGALESHFACVCVCLFAPPPPHAAYLVFLFSYRITLFNLGLLAFFFTRFSSLFLFYYSLIFLSFSIIHSFSFSFSFLPNAHVSQSSLVTFLFSRFIPLHFLFFHHLTLSFTLSSDNPFSGNDDGSTNNETNNITSSGKDYNNDNDKMLCLYLKLQSKWSGDSHKHHLIMLMITTSTKSELAC